MAKITIDGKEYDSEKMSDYLRSQLVSLQFTDTEIANAQMRVAVLQTARIAYSKAVQEHLEKEGL